MKTIHPTLLDNGVTLTNDLVITQAWDEVIPTLELNGVEVPSILSDYYQVVGDETGYDGDALYELNQLYYPMVSSSEEATSWANLFDCFRPDEDLPSQAGFIIPANPNASIQLLALGVIQRLTNDGFTGQPCWITEYRYDPEGYFYPRLYDLPLTPATASLQDIWDCILNPELAYLPYFSLPPREGYEVTLVFPEHLDQVSELRRQGLSEQDASRLTLSALYNRELPPISFSEW